MKKDILIILAVALIGGIYGFIYEEIFYYFDLGYLVKRGITFGPWITIYSIGSIIIYLLTKNKKPNIIKIFMISIIASAIIEYFFGYILLNIFNTRLWDYNTEILNFGNINGFVCLRSILFFGLSSIILIFLLIPLINKIINKDSKIINLIILILGITYFLDIVTSTILFIINN